MPFVLRQSQDEDNPRLPDAYGKQITAGRLVYYEFDGTRTKFIVFLCRGGEFGCEGLTSLFFSGQEVPEFASPGVPNWIFHPGTVTTQISPKVFAADNSSNRLFCSNHGFADNDFVRVRAVVGGMLPQGLGETVKYRVIEANGDSFRLFNDTFQTPVDFQTNGTGTQLVWRADAGVDDPVQGSPKLFPGIHYTFSGICYVEGYVPQQFSQANTEPDKFKFIVNCRKIANYDDNGNIQAADFSANNARVAADILLQELKLPASRIDWPSWKDFRNACEVPVWHRTTASSFAVGTGLTGYYYNHPPMPQFTWSIPEFSTPGVTLVKTRGGEEIDFDWAAGAPVAGLQVDWFLVRWEGKLRPSFSETYTFSVTADNGVRLWVNDQPVIDRWTQSTGTTTGTIALQKNQLVNFRFEFFEGWGLAYVHLNWSSPSQPFQIVPRSRLYPLDHTVKRYEAHLAIPSAMTAWQAFEEVMERAPGWHWQDVSGKIVFLPPNRGSVHSFVYDPEVQGAGFNIASKTFEAAPRPPEERVNYQRYEFRDVETEGYAQSYIEAHRTDLREQQGGMPSDTPLLRMGVMTRSLAERIAETRMRLMTDPERQFILRGQLDSYRVSKGDRVTLSHLLSGDKYSSPVNCLVTGETTGGNADEKTYTLLPVTFPFYTDEPA